MFGISGFEFLIIILVAVVVLGPEKLPKVLRTVTKAMSTFRKVTTDIQRTVNFEMTKAELDSHENTKNIKYSKPKQDAPQKTDDSTTSKPNSPSVELIEEKKSPANFANSKDEIASSDKNNKENRAQQPVKSSPYSLGKTQSSIRPSIKKIRAHRIKRKSSSTTPNSILDTDDNGQR